MATYVWKDGAFRCKRTGEPMPMPARDEICMPRVMGDIPEYRSPVGDHKMITSRSERREDLRRHGCVEVPPRETPRGLKNRRFAEKNGLTDRLLPTA